MKYAFVSRPSVRTDIIEAINYRRMNLVFVYTYIPTKKP